MTILNIFSSVVFSLIFVYGVIFCGFLCAWGVEEKHFLTTLAGLIPLLGLIGLIGLLLGAIILL